MSNFHTKHLLSFLLVCFAAFGHAQDLDAVVSFKDGRQEEVVLNRSAFNAENRLLKHDEVTQIDLEEVAEVSVDGKLYLPVRVSINLPSNDNELVGDLNLVKLDTLLLLQKLVGGSLSLFLYFDHEQKEHFFLQKTGVTQELLRTSFMRNGKVGYKDLYKGIIKTFANDCANLSGHDYDKIKFLLGDIKRFVITYNKLCGKQDYLSKPPKYKVRAGLFGGYQFHFSHFDNGVALTNFGAKQIVLNQVDTRGFLMGAFVHLPLSKSHENLYLELKPSFTSSMGFSESINSYLVDHTDTADIHYAYKANYFNIVLQFRYYLKSINSNYKFYLSTGLGARYILKTSENLMFIHRYRGSFERFTDSPLFDQANLPKKLFTIHSKMGIRLKRFDIGTSFAFGKKGITALDNEKHWAVALELGYFLFK